MIELHGTSPPPGDAEEGARAPSPSETPYHSLPESGEALGVGMDDVYRDDTSYVTESKQPGVLTEKQSKTLVTAMYLSVAAVAGVLLRIALAQLFGEECANPGTVGWLAASSPLCVTADGEASREGGIIFADLPSNLLGCFIMGMMQSGVGLGLPFDVPIAWLSPFSFFQEWDIMHLVIRSGFCGSLTTFSSWNSEMVVMIMGTGSSYTSQVIRALFGYVIGMETALGSFVFGQKVALWIHRAKNPLSAQEMDAIFERKKQGVYIHRELPAFERRFLPDLGMDDVGPMLTGLEFLERWRRSTCEARRVGHVLLPTLIQIERSILVDSQPFSTEAAIIAENAGWDVDALQEWAKINTPPEPLSMNTSRLFKLPVACAIFGTVELLLVLGLIFVNDVTVYSVTYRTMIYASLFAPLGALLRWFLSGFNSGKLLGEHSWIPIGTLTANLLGSMVSITMIATELRVPAANGFWAVGTLRAVKVGFSGCLTTVSTFVSEVHAMMQMKPQQYRAYLYMLMSLVTACLLSMAIYGSIVFT